MKAQSVPISSSHSTSSWPRSKSEVGAGRGCVAAAWPCARTLSAVSPERSNAWKRTDSVILDPPGTVSARKCMLECCMATVLPFVTGRELFFYQSCDFMNAIEAKAWFSSAWPGVPDRSAAHTYELPALMRTTSDVLSLKQKKQQPDH